MSILNATDFPIVAATTSGNQLADILNRLFNAYESNQSNSTRPPELKAGGLWTKIDGTSLRLMMYDGAVDLEIGHVTGGQGQFGNVTTPLATVYSPAATYKAGDMIYDPITKGYLISKNDKVPGPYVAGDWTALGNPFTGVKDAIMALVDAKLANYLPLSGGTLTGALTVNSTIHASGEISSTADVVAFKP